jgi:hypothetical protein
MESAKVSLDLVEGLAGWLPQLYAFIRRTGGCALADLEGTDRVDGL